MYIFQENNEFFKKKKIMKIKNETLPLPLLNMKRFLWFKKKILDVHQVHHSIA